MGMDHGVYVGPAPVDLQVHLALGGGMAVSLDHGAVQVRHQQHVRGHPSLADTGGCDEQAALAYPHGDVAVVGGHIAPVIQEFPYPTDGLPFFLKSHTHTRRM